MTLSLILCSRNDEYMGNSRWRLETTLNYVAERVQELGPRARDGAVEVLVADWGSEIPLRDVLRLTPAAARIVSFVTVPPALARERQRDSPFPEVLALNAAARRARGAYIGRIDQDTLVGTRFLRAFFDIVEGTRHLAGGATPDCALFFANRRSIPYRVVSGSPNRQAVARFVRLFGARLSVWRENPVTGHLFWTSYVGIWLAHRNLWHECGGYDERLIYYNWMETEMICRLRQKYPMIDLGELTDYDFYHLDHHDPREAPFTRRHAIKNAHVDTTAVPAVIHPNTPAWGLHECALRPQAALSESPDGVRDPGGSWQDHRAFALLMLRFTAGALTDPLAARARIVRHKFHVIRRALSGQPVTDWIGVLSRLASRRTSRLRGAVAETLSALGLLAMARRLRLRIGLATNRDIRRRDAADRERFVSFRQDYGVVLRGRLNAGAAKRALVVSSRCPTVEGELCTIKALQVAGFRPVVLLEDERRALRPYYELAGVDKIHLWSEFLTSHDHSREAAAVVGRCDSLDDLLRFTDAGVRVGMIAACTALRRERRGTLDMRVHGVPARLARCVAASLSSAAEARDILRVVRPALVLTDTEYTPKGELFDACLESGLDVIAYDLAHRSDALVFKRYGTHNRDRHLTTLSSDSWLHVRTLDWTQERRDRLINEVTTSYHAGEWFGTPWTPSIAPTAPGAVRKVLGLDADRKTAFIFPHMLWDAPVMWGKPLFSTYQEWFVETVKAACRNDRVNWVIKIHPAHVWKQADEHHRGDPAEMGIIQQHVGALPPHVTVLPPDTPFSTLSLLPVMDYCLTVRGTVGVEAARLGIPVLTAGPARYSELGFTVDSATRDGYLSRLERIEDTPPLSAAQRELAERFAYGLFLLRPLTLKSVTWDAPAVSTGHRRTERRARIHVKTEDAWPQAADMGALADWFLSRDEDFLNSPA